MEQHSKGGLFRCVGREYAHPHTHICVWWLAYGVVHCHSSCTPLTLPGTIALVPAIMSTFSDLCSDVILASFCGTHSACGMVHVHACVGGACGYMCAGCMCMCDMRMCSVCIVGRVCIVGHSPTFAYWWKVGYQAYTLICANTRRSGYTQLVCACACVVCVCVWVHVHMLVWWVHVVHLFRCMYRAGVE